MTKRGLSQETLKLIACVTMLIDHVGYIFIHQYPWYYVMRVIGRLAFPIYCFLLAEGAHYTRNPKRYALRLAVGAVLAELPFDLAFFGGWYWGHQNVMVTLLLGFLALKAMEKCPNLFWKLAVSLPFALAAKLLKTDYSWEGVMLIVLFGLTREMPHRRLIQLLGMIVISLEMSSFHIPMFGIAVPVQIFGVFAMALIGLYSGRKATGSKAAQWGFYLFYPAHLCVLYLIGVAG